MEGQITIHGGSRRAKTGLLDTGALTFLALLDAQFETRRAEVLRERAQRRRRITDGSALADGSATRDHGWAVSRSPAYLRDRRVEVIGPAEAQSLRGGLASAGRSYIADFEYHTAHDWGSILKGHAALRRAATRSTPSSDRVLAIMPRELGRDETHATVGDRPMSAALFDFGLFAFHTARRLAAKGRGPYVRLPRIHTEAEAGWWNHVFVFVEEELRLARGTIRATAQIETVPAALAMDEILYALREHAAGLCGDRDHYVEDLNVVFRLNGNGRHAAVRDDSADALTRLLVQTCHRRGAHAFVTAPATNGNGGSTPHNGGQAGQTVDERIRDGLDGLQVDRAALAPIVLRAFGAHGVSEHQIDRNGSTPAVSPADLLPH